MRIMASNKSMGLFWGEEKLHFVENTDNLPARISTIPLSSIEGAIETSFDDILVFDRMVSAIQKKIHDERITATQIYCSIPNSVLVIRSFVIPHMGANEVGPAVEFEIKKYIPFPLSDLSYTYQCIPFSEGKVKKLRVVFMGCRSKFLERLLRILQKAGLEVTVCEPAPISFIRALIIKKIIAPNEKIAVICVEPSVARILFVSEGVVMFMREFAFALPLAEGMAPPEEQAVRGRFVNEIQNSLEFYSRSFNQDIDHMAVFSADPSHTFASWLELDTGMKIKTIDAMDIVGSQPLPDQMGVISGFGVSAFPDFKSKYPFNLAKKNEKPVSSMFGPPTIDIWEYINSIKTAAVCGALIAVFYVWSQYSLTDLKAAVQGIETEQGKYSDLTAADIEEKVVKTNKIFDSYKKIVFKNEITPPFYSFAKLMPEGLTLKSFEMNQVMSDQDEGESREPYWKASISGYLYNPDINKQIQEVNKFAALLRADKNFQKYFKSITVGMLQQDYIEGHAVMGFQLECN